MNTETLNLKDSDSRQEWLLRYALGELPEDQAELVEAVLENDPALCDELTSLMRLNVAIVAALRSDSKIVIAPFPARHDAGPPGRDVRLDQRRTVVGLACAALVACAVMLIVASPPAEDSLLAEAETFVQLVDDEFVPDAGDILDETVCEDSLASLVAPAWLLTAVELDESGAAAAPDTLNPDDQEVF